MLLDPLNFSIEDCIFHNHISPSFDTVMENRIPISHRCDKKDFKDGKSDPIA